MLNGIHRFQIGDIYEGTGENLGDNSLCLCSDVVCSPAISLVLFLVISFRVRAIL